MSQYETVPENVTAFQALCPILVSRDGPADANDPMSGYQHIPKDWWVILKDGKMMDWLPPEQFAKKYRRPELTREAARSLADQLGTPFQPGKMARN